MNDRDPTPEEVRRLAEKRELQRQLCQRIVDNHTTGRRYADEATLQSARQFLRANPPLRGPLGTGEEEQGRAAA